MKINERDVKLYPDGVILPNAASAGVARSADHGTEPQRGTQTVVSSEYSDDEEYAEEGSKRAAKEAKSLQRQIRPLYP